MVDRVKPPTSGAEVLDFLVSHRNLGVSPVTMHLYVGLDHAGMADRGEVEVQVLCYVIEDEKTGDWAIEPLAVVVPGSPLVDLLYELPEMEESPAGPQPPIETVLAGMVCSSCGASPDPATNTVHHRVGCAYRARTRARFP